MKKLMIVSAALVAVSAQAGWGDLGKAAAKDATAVAVKSAFGGEKKDASRCERRSCSAEEQEKKEKMAKMEKEEMAKKESAAKQATSGASELDQKIAAQQAKVDAVSDWANFGPESMFGLKFGSTKDELKNSGKLTGWSDKSYKSMATLVKPFRKFAKVDLYFTEAGRLYEIKTMADMESVDARNLEKSAIVEIFQKKFGDKLGVMDDNFRGTGMNNRIGIDWQVKRKASDQWGCFMAAMKDNIIVDHESVPNGKIWLEFSQLELREYDQKNAELQKLLKVKNSAKSADEGMDAL